MLDALSFDHPKHDNKQHRVRRRAQRLIQEELDDCVTHIELPILAQKFLVILLVFGVGSFQK